MKISVLGGDGYCGWATALYLSKRGHSLSIVDNFIRRQWDYELGVQTLTPIRTLTERIAAWRAATGLEIVTRQFLPRVNWRRTRNDRRTRGLDAAATLAYQSKS